MATTRNDLRIPLSAVVYQESRWWIAHCLELDLVAEGASPEDATRALYRLTEFQLAKAMEEGDVTTAFRPAPADVWRMYWLAGKQPDSHAVPRFKPKAPVDRFETRQLALT
jgi:hypothetical protein